MDSILSIVNRVGNHLGFIKKQEEEEQTEAEKQKNATHARLIGPIKEAVSTFNKSGAGKKYNLEFAGSDYNGIWYYVINIIPNSERIVISPATWMGENFVAIFPECPLGCNTDPWADHAYDTRVPKTKKENINWTTYERMGVALTVGYEFLYPEEAAEMLVKILAAYAGGYKRFSCWGKCEKCKEKCVKEFLGIPSLSKHNLSQNDRRHKLIQEQKERENNA